MNKTNTAKAALRAAFPATVPVMTGFLVLGFAYGILMQTKGYGVVWATAMSALPSSRSSCLIRPTPDASSSDRKELEQTSSASCGMECAGE